MTTHPPTWYTTELHGASSWILRHHYTRVALQFPPNLLHHSPSTLATLSTLLGLINPSSTTAAAAAAAAPSPAIKLFIVGDTSFSPCCVDEVAAAHYGADCVLHFGHTCMTPTRKLPAYHVLGPSATATGGGDLDATACGVGIASQVLAAVAAGERVVLLWDATVAPALQSVLDEAGRALGVVGGAPSTALDTTTPLEDSTQRRWASPHPSLIVAYAERAVQHQQQQQEEGKESHPHPLERVCGLHTGLDLSHHHHHHHTQSTELPALRALYLGSSLDRERSLVGCWGGWFKGGVWRLDPTTTTTTTATSSTPTPTLSTALPSHARLLASRYRYVSLIKEAGCVGIVAGTLAVEGHVGMVEALRAALVGAGKGVYVLLVGKLTPAKLANFHGVCDALVLVACPEASLLGGEEAATHAIPIATPHEALVALEELAREEEGRVAEEEGGEGQGQGVEEGDGGAGRERKGGDDPSLAWDGALVLSFNALLHRLKGSKAWGRAVGRQKPPRQGGNALEQQGQEEAQVVGGVESLGIDSTTTTTTALTTQWEGSKALSLGGKGVGEASRRLLTREWRGLAYEVDGSDSTTDIAQGQMGIASRYVGEVKK